MSNAWADAPEWASYRAQDADGYWCWYEQKPVDVDAEWQMRGEGRVALALPESQAVAGWRLTLEKRP